MNFGNRFAFNASIGFFVVAILTILYSICLYLWRVVQIRNKRPVRYDDRIGPTVICFALAFATGLNFFLLSTN